MSEEDIYSGVDEDSNPQQVPDPEVEESSLAADDEDDTLTGRQKIGETQRRATSSYYDPLRQSKIQTSNIILADYNKGNFADLYSKIDTSALQNARSIVDRANRPSLINEDGRPQLNVNKEPSGFSIRPDIKDWQSWHSRFANYEFTESTYQLQNTAYNQVLGSRTARTRVATQDIFETLSTAGSIEEAQKGLSVLGGNLTSKHYLDSKGSLFETRLANLKKPDKGYVPAFHAKIGYFSEGQDVKAAYIGTQNRTNTLETKDTAEEVLFLREVFDSKGNVTSFSRRILQEAKVVADALFEAAGQIENTAGETKNRLSTLNTGLTHFKFNEAIHERRLQTVQQAVKSGERVVVSLQYLEENLFKDHSADTPYDNNSRDFFTALKNLGDRLIITLPNSSHTETAGLFALFDRLKDPNSKDSDFVAKKEDLLKFITDRVSVLPTMYAHSKTLLTFNSDLTEVTGIDISSANQSEQAYLHNIDAGVALRGREIQDAGIDTRELLNYVNHGVAAKVANKGAFVERLGDEDMVDKTIGILKRMGGEYTRQSRTESPFTFSARYDATTGKRVGLDITLQDKYSFSVTIGSVRAGRYDTKTGKQVLEDKPVLYINKGNRVIVGMEWLNDSTTDVILKSAEGKDRVVNKGEMASLDAIQVLAGIITTMDTGLRFESDGRVLFQSLERLLGRDENQVKKLIQETFYGQSPEGDALADRKYRELKNIVQTKNVAEIVKANEDYKTLIANDPSLSSFYISSLRRSKKELFTQLTEIYPQLHSLSYTDSQLWVKRPIYSLTKTAQNIHYQESLLSKDPLILTAPLLSDYPLEHGKPLVDSDGKTFIRGVADSGRPSNYSADKMLGGLVKVEGGTPMPFKLDFLNSIGGLAAISYNDYIQRLETAGIESSIRNRLTNTVFALEFKRLRFELNKKDDEDLSENEKAQALVLYFTYPKMEQIPQRLKNLKSVRSFLPVNPDLVDYARNFGLASNIDQERKFSVFKGRDAEAGSFIGGQLATAMPSMQFALFKEESDKLHAEVQKGTLTAQEAKQRLEKKFRNLAATLEQPIQGFIDRPRYIMINYGISEMSDYSYVNAQLANRTGYFKHSRAQIPLETSQIKMTPMQFTALLNEKLVPGTLFVARDVEVSDSFLSNLNDRLKAGLANDGVDLENSVDVRKWLEDRGLSSLKYRESTFYLKKGVYNPIQDEGGRLSINRIGGVQEDHFYLNDVFVYTTTGRREGKQQYMEFRNAAISSRLQRGVAFLMGGIQVSTQDLRSSSFTVEMNIGTVLDHATGTRTSAAKGPGAAKNERYFQIRKEIFERERGRLNPLLGESDIFAVITPTQMKGFLFKAGLELVSQGMDSNLVKEFNLKRVSIESGKRIAKALSLLTLSDSGVVGRLKGHQGKAYKVALANLQGKLKKPKARVIGGDNVFDPTLAVFEGLVGLIDPNFIDEGSTFEVALAKTVDNALKGGEAAQELSQKTYNLLQSVFTNYAEGRVSGKLSFDETKARSLGVLAYLLEASKSLYMDIDKNFRNAQPGLLELGYKREGFMEVYKKSPFDRQSMTDYMMKEVFSSSDGSLTQSDRYDLMQRVLMGVASPSTLNSIYRGAENNFFNALTASTEGISAFTLYQFDNEEGRAFRAGVRSQANSLGINLPHIDELHEKDKAEELRLALLHLGAIGQYGKSVVIPFDMLANKITVPTGLQNTTALEAHYAQALTNRQMQLYSVTASDRDKVTSMQGTLVYLGALIERGLNNRVLTPNTVEDIYSIASLDISTLDKTGDLSESVMFGLSFTQAYSNVSSKKMSSPFANALSRKDKAKKTPGGALLDVPLTYTLFDRFIRTGSAKDKTVLEATLDHMKVIQEIAVGYTGLSVEERADLIAQDFLSRITDKSAAGSVVVDQVQSLLQNVVEDITQKARFIEKASTKFNKLTGGTGGPNVGVDRALRFVLERMMSTKPEDVNYFTQTLKDLNFAKRHLSSFLADIIYGRDKAELSTLNQAQRRKLFSSMVGARLASQGIRTESELKAAGGRVYNYILDALDEPDSELRAVLKSIVGSEVKDRINSSLHMGSGKEYIKSKQVLREHALGFLNNANSTPEQRRRASLLKASLEKTFVLAIPSLQMSDYDKGQAVRQATLGNETYEGTVLSLDIMERMSLVFPGHSHEALIAQQRFAGAIEEAREVGLLKAMAQQKVMLNTEQIQAYQNLISAAEGSTREAMDLANNTETLRKALGDRISLSGSSYIAMSSFLLNKTEVGLGSRIDLITEANKGAGLNNLVSELFTTMNTAGRKNKDMRANALVSLQALGASLGLNEKSLAAKKLLGFKDISSLKKLLGIANKDGLTKQEMKLFLTNLLVARQGAPSGTFANYATGHTMKQIEGMADRSKLYGSIAGPDIENSSTALYISAIGDQYTQLGDYDGDSFQVALTKMSAASKELAEAHQKFNQLSKYGANLTGAAGDYYKAQRSASIEQINAAAQDVAEKTMAVKELQSKVGEETSERIRIYSSQFLALPMGIMEGDGTRSGALKDTDLSTLVKQYRDTLTGFYENRDLVASTLTKELVSIGSEQQLAASKGEAGVIYKQFARVNENSVGKLSLSELKERLIEFSAEVSQDMVAFRQQFKLSEKILGSLINEDALQNIQAVIGFSGGSLLGKTYNTLVPLLTLAIGDMANMERLKRLDGEKDPLRELLKKQTEKKIAEVQAQIAADSEDQSAKNRLAMLDRLLNNFVDPEKVVSSIVLEKSQQRVNTVFGLVLNVQQFLRDAALKPKEGGSVAQAASDFEYAVTYTEGETKQKQVVKGLHKILALVDSQERSQVMSQFLGTKVGDKLKAEWEFKADSSGRMVSSQEAFYDAGLLAFSALEMTNEYLSGSKSADEMMESSAFKGYLRDLKGRLSASNELVTNKFVVEHALANMLARFRANFIYANVIEADSQQALLTPIVKRITDAYKESSILARIGAYRDKLTDAYDKTTLSAQEKAETIDRYTSEFEAEERAYQSVVQEAAKSGKPESVVRAMIDYNTQQEAAGYQSLFSDAVTLNSGIQSSKNEDSQIALTTQQAIDLGQGLMLENIRGGKNTAEVINSIVSNLATNLKNVGENSASTSSEVAQATSGLLATGGAVAVAGPEVLAGLNKEEGSQMLSLIGEVATSLDDEGKSYAGELVKESSKAAFRERQQSVIAAINTEMSAQYETLQRMESDLNKAVTASGSTLPELEQEIAQTQSEIESLQKQSIALQGATPDLVGESFMQEIMMANHLSIKESEAKRLVAERSEIARFRIQKEEQVRKLYGNSSLVSLLSVPIFFAAAQGAASGFDKFASLATNVIESSLTAISYEGSALRSELFGKHDKVAVRSADRLNLTTRAARAKMGYSTDDNLTAATAQALAFESIYAFGSIAASKVYTPKSKASRVGVEVAGALLGAAIANLVTERNIPDTPYDYDETVQYNLRAMEDMISSMNQAVYDRAVSFMEGDDVAIIDEETGEELDANVGDIAAIDENYRMSFEERFRLMQSNLDEDAPIEVEA